MPQLIALVGFAGGWLLFAGPLLQAWLELREEQFGQKEMQDAVASIPPPEHVSTWWWLLPPVAWIKTQRRQNTYRAAVMKLLTPEQREQTITFFNKANAWFVVAGGAFLIAVKETWEAVEQFELWVGLFWILIVLMPVICVTTLALRAAHTRGALNDPRDPASARRPPRPRPPR